MDAEGPDITITGDEDLEDDATIDLDVAISGGHYDVIDSQGWSVVSGGGSIDTDGVYTPASVNSSTSVTVRYTVTVSGDGTTARDGSTDTVTEDVNFNVTPRVVVASDFITPAGRYREFVAVIEVAAGDWYDEVQNEGSIIEGDLSLDFATTDWIRARYNPTNQRFILNRGAAQANPNVLFIDDGLYEFAEHHIQLTPEGPPFTFDHADIAQVLNRSIQYATTAAERTAFGAIASGDRIIIAMTNVHFREGDGRATEMDLSASEATGTKTGQIALDGDGSATTMSLSAGAATGENTARAGDGTATTMDLTAGAATGESAIAGQDGDGQATTMNLSASEATGAGDVPASDGDGSATTMNLSAAEAVGENTARSGDGSATTMDLSAGAPTGESLAAGQEGSGQSTTMNLSAGAPTGEGGGLLDLGVLVVAAGRYQEQAVLLTAGSTYLFDASTSDGTVVDGALDLVTNVEFERVGFSPDLDRLALRSASGSTALRNVFGTGDPYEDAETHLYLEDGSVFTFSTDEIQGVTARVLRYGLTAAQETAIAAISAGDRFIVQWTRQTVVEADGSATTMNLTAGGAEGESAIAAHDGDGQATTMNLSASTATGMGPPQNAGDGQATTMSLAASRPTGANTTQSADGSATTMNLSASRPTGENLAPTGDGSATTMNLSVFEATGASAVVGRAGKGRTTSMTLSASQATGEDTVPSRAGDGGSTGMTLGTSMAEGSASDLPLRAGDGQATTMNLSAAQAEGRTEGPQVADGQATTMNLSSGAATGTRNAFLSSSVAAREFIGRGAGGAFPRAFLGSATDGAIYILTEGYDDAGEPIAGRLRTREIAPAGPDADISFERVYIAISWSAPIRMICTPVLDGVLLPDAAFTVDLEGVPGRQRRHAVLERILARVRSYRGEEVLRYVPRGTWFSFQIDARLLGPGELIVNSIALEYEALSPTKRLV